MSKTAIKIGPADHGRQMSLDDFEQAEEQEGYQEKPAEYLRFGVKEYWIVDAEKRVMVVMRRSRGRWVETTVKPPAIYRPRLLPGFELSIDDVFKSAGLI
jgi:Uma2 family endonuclease